MHIEELDYYKLSSNFTMVNSNSSLYNMFAVIVETGVHILEIVPNLSVDDCRVSVRRALIKTPKEFPLADLRIDVSKLNREEFCYLNLDAKITPHLEKLSVPDVYTKQVGWMQLKNERSSQPVLVILSNHASFQLFVKLTMNWTKAADLSLMWRDHCSKTWLAEEDKGDFKSVEKQFNYIRITAFTPCERFYDADSNQFLLTAVSQSGILSFWKIFPDIDKAPPILAGTFETNLAVYSLHWFSISDKNGWIVVTCTDGTVKIFSCEEDDRTQTISTKLLLDIWREADLILVSNLKIRKRGHKKLLVFSKENYVCIFTIREEKVLKENYYELEKKVAGLDIVNDNHLLVVLTNNDVCDLQVDIEKCTFGEPVPVPFNTNTNISNHRCYGISLSKSKLWCIFFMKICQNYDHLVIKEPSYILLCSLKKNTEVNVVELEKLIKTNIPFYELHDYVEYIRFNVFKSNEVSIQNKIALTWSYLKGDLEVCRKFFQMAYILSKCYKLKIPKYSVDHKDDVNVIEVIFGICNFLYFQDKITAIKKQYLFCKWLEANIDKLPNHIRDYDLLRKIIDKKNNYTSFSLDVKCELCSSNIVNHNNFKYVVCEKGHNLLRCSFSFLPITTQPVRECSICSSTALANEEIDRCVICDNIF